MHSITGILKIMQDFSKSSKITGLEKLIYAGANVPAFNFIPDFRELNIDYAALTPKFKIPLLQTLITETLDKLGDNPAGYSVRSASFDEDNSSLSAAGKYISYNGLKNPDEIYTAMIAIWKHQRTMASKETLCPVILQKTHCSYFSGVFFKNYSQQEPLYVSESYFGSCKNIVDGILKPYTSTFNGEKWVHHFDQENNYCYKFYASPFLYTDFSNNTLPGNLLKYSYPVFPEQVRLYTDKNFNEIMVYGYRPSMPPEWYTNVLESTLKPLADSLESPQGIDIEWGSDPDGKVYLYQFRPLTRPITAHKPVDYAQEKLTDQKIIIGSPASPGQVEGYVVKSNQAEIEPKILQLNQATVTNLKELEGVAGIICTTGGILSHLAIVARELGLPCIMGTSARIPVNTKVKLDGTTGIIEHQKNH